MMFIQLNDSNNIPGCVSRARSLPSESVVVRDADCSLAYDELVSLLPVFARIVMRSLSILVAVAELVVRCSCFSEPMKLRFIPILVVVGFVVCLIWVCVVGTATGIICCCIPIFFGSVISGGIATCVGCGDIVSVLWSIVDIVSVLGIVDILSGSCVVAVWIFAVADDVDVGMSTFSAILNSASRVLSSVPEFGG